MEWFILEIIDTHEELHENHPENEYLIQLILKSAETMIGLQRDDGGFNSVLTINARYDSSITVLAGLLFLKSYQITKEMKYYLASRNCLKSLMGSTRRNGAVDNCQGDTKGIGVYAEVFDLMPFVQGLTVRLSQSLAQIGEGN